VVNIAVVVLVTALLRAARVSNGTDLTQQSDYFADLGDPGVERLVTESRPIH
jgi:solute:Na+ symporter, SSS family